MDNYRMNRGGCRSGVQSGYPCQQTRQNGSCRPSGRIQPENRAEMYRHLDGKLPAAMGYVPYQKWGDTFELSKALQMGTIFPDLCKPFCGKGGAVCP